MIPSIKDDFLDSHNIEGIQFRPDFEARELDLLTLLFPVRNCHMMCTLR
jgi:hypothetical protein